MIFFSQTKFCLFKGQIYLLSLSFSVGGSGEGTIVCGLINDLLGGTIEVGFAATDSLAADVIRIDAVCSMELRPN